MGSTRSPIRPEPLILASASPRRTELLAALGVRHLVKPAPSPEIPHGSEPAAEHARRSARAKALEVALAHPGRVVLGADTVVSVGPGAHEVLGKPADAADAVSMLRLLSGRTHDVVTGLALLMHEPGAGGLLRESIRSARTRVSFRQLSPAFIDRYVVTGEPMDKAGAYGVQGRLASHVGGIDGSWSNVVGLPQELLPLMFEDLGLDLKNWQDW